MPTPMVNARFLPVNNAVVGLNFMNNIAADLNNLPPPLQLGINSAQFTIG